MRALLPSLPLALLAVSGPAAAIAPPVDDWRAVTAGDVDAAYTILAQNHPGAAAEMQDVAFRAGLEAGRALALQRAATVTDFGGYAATMRGFASGLGDAHLRWHPTRPPDTVRYPGFWMDLRGRDWVVVARDDAAGPAVGARLLECDGEPPASLVAARLAGFRADPANPAQVDRAAPWLLVDDGNPFVPTPRACRFEGAGAVQDLPLAWRPIAVGELSARAATIFPRPEAGFGVRSFDGGVWIALQRLDEAGAAVVRDVAARRASLADAPTVVVDLRGNGGGDSSIGDDLARTLYGAAAVAGARRDKPGCGEVWRASEGNLRTLERYQVQFAARGARTVAGFEAQAHRVAAALVAGHALSGPVEGCLEDPPLPAPPAAPPRGAPYRGKVVVLTDGACFSSCLLLVERLRALGAVQAGRPTDAGTWYMEVREEPLPSGLGTFSVLGKVGLGAPRRLGPFLPAVAYDGDMNDVAALEGWVAATFHGGPATAPPP